MNITDNTWWDHYYYYYYYYYYCKGLQYPSSTADWERQSTIYGIILLLEITRDKKVQVLLSYLLYKMRYRCRKFTWACTQQTILMVPIST